MDFEHGMFEHSEELHVREPDEDLADPLGVADKTGGEAASAHTVRLAPPEVRIADAVPPSDPKHPIIEPTSGRGRRLPAGNLRLRLVEPRPSWSQVKEPPRSPSPPRCPYDTDR
jgi:hypothetical protein